eukprot:1775595-Pyramimonas_sp.AAC.1
MRPPPKARPSGRRRARRRPDPRTASPRPPRLRGPSGGAGCTRPCPAGRITLRRGAIRVATSSWADERGTRTSQSTARQFCVPIPSPGRR